MKRASQRETTKSRIRRNRRPVLSIPVGPIGRCQYRLTGNSVPSSSYTYGRAARDAELLSRTSGRSCQPALSFIDTRPRDRAVCAS